MPENEIGSRAFGLLSFILRILVMSLVVGLVLSWLGIDPRSILRGSWDAILAAPRAVGEAVAWTIPHILTGAMIVVPITAIGLVVRALGRARPERRTNRADDSGPLPRE